MARIPFGEVEPTVEPKERPAIRGIEDVWCWMNTWGDLRKHGYAHGSGADVGYRQCIRDLHLALAEAGIDDVPDEAWERWTA